MRTGNKIAWIYTWLMMGLVCLVGLLFYLLTAHSINRIYNSFLAERANATAVKLWEKDELDEVSYALVKKRYEQTLPSTQEIILNADSAGTRNTLSHYLEEEQIKSLLKGELIYFDQDDDRKGVALYYPDNEGNFIILILSNNRSSRRVETFCRDLGISYVGHAGKPSPRGYREAMALAGIPAKETAMLGDKLLTDILGAKRSQVTALMVEPLGGAVGAWNHVLHLLQRPFKAAARRRCRKNEQI